MNRASRQVSISHKLKLLSNKGGPASGAPLYRSATALTPEQSVPLNPANVLMVLQGGPLAAELNTAHDLTTLKGGPLAAELNTAHDLHKYSSLN